MRPIESCPVCRGSDLRPFAMDAWTPGQLHFAQARCRGCGLVAAQPQATADELDAYYKARYYEQHQLDEETHWRVNVRDYPLYELPMMERLWSRFPPPRGATVAEIGCGHGSLLTVLGERGYRARGCELSPSAVEFCRRKGLDVIQGKDLGDPGPKGELDVVASLQVIEHVPDPRAFVRMLVGLARPGGAVVVATEDLWTSQYAFACASAWVRRSAPPYRTSTEHTFVFQATHLERLLREEGCDLVGAASYQREPPAGSLHWRLYKQVFRALDRATGHGEFLMAAGRKA